MEAGWTAGISCFFQVGLMSEQPGRQPYLLHTGPKQPLHTGFKNRTDFLHGAL